MDLKDFIANFAKQLRTQMSMTSRQQQSLKSWMNGLVC